ncbi:MULTISPECIES: DUF423 domain-containing protein [Cyanophyceae]|uniref:DUF423 domain-containing protein n=1 Tax=Cyanophyceae TaxID=3028117 RepID=UPI00016DCB5A|nr:MULTISPECIES: DUF423 domain-containing protein [Cyanophyceae]ACB00003.1 Protein of unknown function (DUF423) [Picosynechococcus sp. PCC 7002]SMH54209.1 Uncharacterized membrane protein YgdD, TMEM256/DUF423 family [Picosynechococcus sp. OG1]SMQ82895.1 Uncharacterized membrane protein YgdD, TMEM256/DUF423 family [Synechococcus sp. 7002]
MTRFFLVIAPILAGLAVAAGAFASHGLKETLDANALDIWETAAKYQMYQAIALLLVGLFSVQGSFPQSWLNGAGIAFIVGIVLFSGSLYALSLSGVKILGAITPLGGAAFIVGWICLAIAGWQFSR